MSRSRDDVVLPTSDDELLALAAPDTPGASDRDGLFDDDAPIRRWSRENAVVMGGGCALLLEVAHPLVAAGVARHSAFREDPFGRLQRTLAAVSSIVFGARVEAVAAARRVETAHRDVHGRLGRQVGPFTADARYSARDPELVAWVWMTVAWTTVRVRERLLEPAFPAELDAFHRDHARVARLLGVPSELAPSTHEGFGRSFDRIRCEALAVGDEARAVAGALLGRGGPGPGAPLPGGGLARALAAALLPEELREPYGLDWGPDSEQRLARLAERIRRLRGPR